MNDTFIAAKLNIDNYYWRGVPFYIRTGKRLKSKHTRMVVEFKDPIKSLGSAQQSITPNLLIFDIGPDEGITLQLNTKDRELKGGFKPVNIDLYPDRTEAPEAYETLINDALIGDSTFFVHWDEVELSWKWVQPILEAFAENEVPLHPYPAGSHGPAAANELLAQDGYRWWFDEPDETFVVHETERAAEDESSEATPVAQVIVG